MSKKPAAPKNKPKSHSLHPATAIVEEKKGDRSKRNLKPARFLDPKSDLVFKRIFGEYPELMISFLNGILPLPEEGLIKTIEYLPSEQVPRIPGMKNTIVDVKCTDGLGRIFFVEMQLNWTTNFMKRLLFGASKAYVQQLLQGEDYHSLCPVYGISIVNDRFDATAEWFHHYRTVNVKDPSIILPGLELIFLELPKFKPETKEHRKIGVLWLRFLREISGDVFEVSTDLLNDPNISKALEIAQESNYTAAELEAYDRFWDAVRIERELLRSLQAAEQKAEAAEQKAEAAEQKAETAEQKAETAEQKAEAAEQKVQENQLEIAKALLLDGFEPSKVARIVKLPIEAILNLNSKPTE